MGIAYNPGAVVNNLVFAFDADNLKSYPGTGNDWYDLSGNGYDAVRVGSRVSYNSSESAF